MRKVNSEVMGDVNLSPNSPDGYISLYAQGRHPRRLREIVSYT